MSQQSTPPGSSTPSEDFALPDELSPHHYIEKIHLATGEAMAEEIRPEDLLVHSHRDYHPVETHARYMLSRVVRATGSRRVALRKLLQMRGLGRRTAGWVARISGRRDPRQVSKTLFGIRDKEHYFRFRRHQLSREEIERRVAELREQAVRKLGAVTGEGQAGIRVLLTGGTGFIGKEFLWQVARESAVTEVVVLIRPKQVRDRKTDELLRVVSPTDRGERLLRQLWLDGPEVRGKFRFVSGDIEEPRLGISDEDFAYLARTISHVVHCAASVAFDDPYDTSFRANVLGTRNALRFSRSLQQTEGSPFVAHLGIETSYIHGRQVFAVARESEVSFPRNYYNNYYELTKAMASIETERFMLDEGLRVTQLCPAIVIGEAATGNNRGDTKVVNAPVNLFGRARQALSSSSGDWMERSKASMLARLACVFPGDPSAQINLIPVDRVVRGIVAALYKPQAVGERIHLANDNRITSEQLTSIVYEELGVKVTLAEPTLHRTIGLPLLKRLLKRFKQERVGQILQKMANVFGGYSEWGQPIHEVGNDVRVLGLAAERPDAVHAFRMLCRHNRYVQRFGRIRDLDEISRRERIWATFVRELEERTGLPAGEMPAPEIQALIERELSFAKPGADPVAEEPGSGAER